MADDMGQALGWDDEIEVSGGGFDPVPDGEYGFEVVNVERGYFNGSAKMGPCPKAKVEVRLTDDARGAHLFENFLLNSKVSWKIAQFFVCVGLRDESAGKDEKLRMDWTRAIGARGRLVVKSREYNGRVYSDVAEWLKPSKAGSDHVGPYVPPQSFPAPHDVQRAVDQAVNQAVNQAVQSAQSQFVGKGSF